MTSPGGYSAGTIFLQVVPSFRNFQDTMRKAAREADKAFAEGMDSGEMAKAFDAALEKQVKSAGKKGDRIGEAMARSVKSQLDSLLRGVAHAITLNVDDSEVDDDLKSVAERLHALDTTIDLDIDAEGIQEARRSLEQLRDELLLIMRYKNIDIRVQAVLDREIAKIDKLNGELKELQKTAKRIGLDATNQEALRGRIKGTMTTLAPLKNTVELDSSDAEKEAFRVATELEALLNVTADVDLSTDDIKRVQGEFRALVVQLSEIDRDDLTIETRALVEGALADLKMLEIAASRLDRMRVKVDARVQGAAGAAESLRGFNAMILLVAATGPALVPVLGSIAAGLLAIGPAAAAAGAGLGVMALGFSGVAPAVQAMSAMSKDGAEQARALAKTQRAAGKAVVDAERGVVRAREAAGKAAADQARAVEDAQRGIVSAQKDAARAVAQAVKGVERAERDLARAQRDSQEAQENLRAARNAAKDDLLDLESKVKKGALDERQMLIDLFEAQVAYNAAQADGGATNLEKEQAAIQLERARIAIADQRRENEQLRAEQAKANKEGVEGTDRVVSAREKVVDAAEREKDATTQVADARERAQEAQEQGAERIAAAQQRLIDAQAAAADQQAGNSDRVADALRNLEHAQANHRDTMLQTTAAADELADAMDRLSPAGQRFAKFIFSLRDEFDRLRAAAQEGMLPGVQRGLEALLPYLPQIESFVSVYANLMGRMMESTLVGLTTQPWRDFFSMLKENGPDILESYGGAMGNLGTVFANVMTAFAPLAQKFADGLERITKAWADWSASAAGQEQMQRFMDYAERVGPKVIDFLDAFFGAIGNALVGLAPYGDMFLGALTGILRFLEALPTDVLGAFVFSLAALVFTIQALSGVFGAFGIVATLVLRISWAFGFAVSTSLALVLAFGLVIVAFGILYAKVDWFRNGVNAVFKFIGRVLMDTWNDFKMAFNFIGAIVMWLWDKIIGPVFGWIADYIRFKLDVVFAVIDMVIKALQMLGGWFGKLYNEYVKPYVDRIASHLQETLGPAFSWLAEQAGKAWDFIKEMFSGGAELVVRVINDYIIAPFNRLAEFFDSDTIKPIGYKAPLSKTTKTAPRSTSSVGGMQAYATGGRVAGFSPTATADNIPAWLTAGEYVLPVEAVKKLRGAYGDQFLEWLRGGGGYAKGGLVEFGRLLQSRAFRVSEHPAFGGVQGRHAKNSYHYSGQAIDVNYGPGGQSAAEMRAIDAIIGLAKDYDLRTIWRTAGHFNHAHFDTGGERGSIIGSIGSALGNAIEWAKDGPLSWFKDKVLGGFADAADSPFGNFVLGMGKKVVDGALGYIAQISGTKGDFVENDPEHKPTLYDNGGWLPPGLSQVMNATGKPELILTPEQAQSVLAGGGKYEINVPMMPTDSTPAEVADAVLFAARQISRGGVYAGRR